MSIDSRFPELPRVALDVITFEVQAPGFPPPRHPAEADLFSRQCAMPGHDQSRLEAAHIVIIGCGGLGSWIGVALARMGVAQLSFIDGDSFDRSNAHRQLCQPEDLSRPKAHVLARHVAQHMTNPGTVRGIARMFCEAAEMPERPSAMVFGVDDNRARLAGSAFARQRLIPAVFGMLSSDGLRAQIFLQEPDGPCLTCVLPNLRPGNAMPCAAASMASCLLVGSHAVAMLTRAIMAAPCATPTWRESSLDGSTERAARPKKRGGCPACGGI